jgi:hypothetical protein
MNDINDHIAETIVRQKVQLITELLSSLSNDHDFHYTFSCALLRKESKNIMFMQNMMNVNMNINVLKTLLQPLNDFYAGSIVRMNLIDTKIVVACLTDREQDAAIVDKVGVGYIYTVKHIHIVEGFKKYYILEGMDHGTSNGYESERFVLLFNSYKQN